MTVLSRDGSASSSHSVDSRRRNCTDSLGASWGAEP
eukprot:CAMPEP_0181213912 /NCGR_PEP_ID=MMETSP1096-20121128/25163_1 /TAXON_ID=156174 ORGANISM="Chrysochromulina ericina, Strain CCMP281" /NCGR_SAMPLE_ID=MMETSP1096 /ASSEMBLY_ACC=CAM_ASM_000453 /LENGTH=35 /DNA_ID= /DNA_START= /DNA_END= /DNA_ORIENTATION=